VQHRRVLWGVLLSLYLMSGLSSFFYPHRF
jgi:hypothetical protein